MIQNDTEGMSIYFRFTSPVHIFLIFSLGRWWNKPCQFKVCDKTFCLLLVLVVCLRLAGTGRSLNFYKVKVSNFAKICGHRDGKNRTQTCRRIWSLPLSLTAMTLVSEESTSDSHILKINNSTWFFVMWRLLLYPTRTVYPSSVGLKIKGDLLDGNAVVSLDRTDTHRVLSFHIFAPPYRWCLLTDWAAVARPSPYLGRTTLLWVDGVFTLMSFADASTFIHCFVAGAWGLVQARDATRYVRGGSGMLVSDLKLVLNLISFWSHVHWCDQVGNIPALGLWSDGNERPDLEIQNEVSASTENITD